jgi:4-diphosphocytidyl-2-C-methyl-D-erythritol kinase
MSTVVRSHAKINLGLAIGPVREDGFHALATVYHTLALAEPVTVRARRLLGDGAGSTIRITSNDPRVPLDGRNTAWRMVEAALLAAGVAAEVEIHIEKRLPVQGGLGAGSGNAAAALAGLEREIGLELAPGERLRLAAEVGSDVPLFLVGGAVLGLGRGEQVFPLPDSAALHAVVALPAVGVSTPEAFADWDRLLAARARQAAGPAESAESALTTAAELARLSALSRVYAEVFSAAGSSGVSSAGGDLAGSRPESRAESGPGSRLLALVRAGIANDFEQVVFPRHSLLGQVKCALLGRGLEDGAYYAALSGSGSALFGLYADELSALAARARVEQLGVVALLTWTLPREAYRAGLLG